MDPHRSAGQIVIGFFLTFVGIMKKQGELTHKEAVKKALEELGGRAQLKQIYPRVIPFVKYKPGSDIKATLRRQLQTTPELFRRTQGRTGWYELVSYQEELAERDRKIVELSESCLTKEIIIKAFDDCDNLAERMNAKYVMTVLFGKFPVWRMAYREMKKKGYFKEAQPQIVFNDAHIDQMAVGDYTSMNHQ